MILDFIRTYMNTPEYGLTPGQRLGMCLVLLFIFVGLPLSVYCSWRLVVLMCEKIRRRRRKK